MMNNMKNVIVNERKINKVAMMEGYLQMAEINKSICTEAFHAANEAEMNQYKFISQY